MNHFLFAKPNQKPNPSRFLDRRLKKECSGTNITNLNQQLLSSVAIPISTIVEQKAIADILSIWDEAIEKNERLIELKEKFFQFFISSKIFNPVYNRKKLKTLVYEVSERNTMDSSRVLSVTNNKGFVLPEEKFKHRVASSNLKNYKVARKGQFAYNPSRINVGSIARLDGWDSGVLSPMYVVFGVNERLLNSDFLNYWLQTREAKKRICAATQGSVRESVSFTDFSNLLVPLPEQLAQKDIVDEVNNFSDELKILKNNNNILVLQKRGLMQKLLTGLWRVKFKEEKNNG